MRIQSRVIIVMMFVFLTAIELFGIEPVWENDRYKNFLQNNVLELIHDQSKIITINSSEFNFIRTDAIYVEDVKTDTLILKLLFIDSDGFHNDFPSQIFLTIAQSNNTFHFTASQKTFNHITIPMKDRGEHYFGLIEKLYPHNSRSPDLRGTVADVEVYGNGEEEYAENYASAYSAFYMSSARYGSFFNSFAKGRYQFAINTSCNSGMVMKPLAYQYFADEKTYDIWDEYIFGNTFLIAPVYTKNNSRMIYLPKGTWYDYHNSGIAYNGPTEFMQTVPLTTTAVFIKGNSIFITEQIFRENSRIWENIGSDDTSIAIHMFPGQLNEQTTFTYVDNLDFDKEKIMLLKHQFDKIEFTSESIAADSTRDVKFSLKPVKIVLNNIPVSFDYDTIKNTASVQTEKNKPIDLQICYIP